MTTRSPSRRFALLVPLLALLLVVLVIEAIVVPLEVFVPADFRDRNATLFGLFEPDAVLGFRARPNLRNFELGWMGNALRASYSTDERGFRNASRSYEDSEIVFVGDSFTWGSWVAREDTFPYLVGRQLDQPILNLAQESFYIEQYEKVVHLLFEEWLPQHRPRQHRPRYVALCIFANDLTIPISDDDIQDFYERFGWNEYREYPLYKKFFVYRVGQAFANAAQWVAVQTGLAAPSPPSHLDRKATASGIELYRQLGAHPYYFSQSYNVQTEQVFRRLLLYIAAEEATPLVFLLPSKESAYQDEYKRLFPGDYLEIEEAGYKRLCEIASELEVACANLTPALRAATKNLDPYFERDPHWNAQGHQLAAAEVLKQIDPSFFPSRQADGAR